MGGKCVTGTVVWLVMVCSIILNLLFIITTRINQDAISELSWSIKAAEEAEAVAAVSCSGHGRAYLDGLVVDDDDHQACECNACYSSSDCSLFSPIGCAAEANGGDPYFLEPFWMQQAAASAVLVSGWHRMSYSYSYTNRSQISTLLETQIRKLHSIVGNAITDGRYIVFGAGSTQLLYAAVHSLSSRNSSSQPARVVASIPYYGLYKQQTEYLGSPDYKFEGDASMWKNSSGGATKIIEFVTSPNNPDGLMNKAVINGSYPIHDHAYYWPHFTSIPAPSDEDVMLFTISKITGHAGTRFGWAVIKDRDVYERMYEHTSVNTMGVSKDSQMRALRVLGVVLGSEGRDIFEFGYTTMRKRWDKLNKVLSTSKRFSVQRIPPEYCTYYQRLREPTPAYAWLKCEKVEDSNCYEVLRGGGINGRAGSVFGARDCYVRLSLIRTQDDFDLLLQRLYILVSDHRQDPQTTTMSM